MIARPDISLRFEQLVELAAFSERSVKHKRKYQSGTYSHLVVVFYLYIAAHTVLYNNAHNIRRSPSIRKFVQAVRELVPADAKNHRSPDLLNERLIELIQRDFS